jgi:hypothetical protein
MMTAEPGYKGGRMQFMVWVVSVLSIDCADANDIPHFHNSYSGATCESKNNDSGLGLK